MGYTFYGNAPIVRGLFLLNLDSDDTHVHNIDAKDVELIMIVPLSCGTAA